MEAIQFACQSHSRVFPAYPAPFELELVLAGQEQKQGSIYKMSPFLLVICPLLVESISP